MAICSFFITSPYHHFYFYALRKHHPTRQLNDPSVGDSFVSHVGLCSVHVSHIGKACESGDIIPPQTVSSLWTEVFANSFPPLITQVGGSCAVSASFTVAAFQTSMSPSLPTLRP